MSQQLSLKEIKTKEIIGKQKTLPKLKVILANPYKLQHKKLSDSDVDKFCQLIRSEITASKLEPKKFATQNHIRLGLQSTLRAIKKEKMSCVLISLAIKPHHIVNQIIYYIRAKDSSVPVYCLSNLQDITMNIFGVRALSVVLPAILSPAFNEWMSELKNAGQVKTVDPAVDIKPHKKNNCSGTSLNQHAVEQKTSKVSCSANQATAFPQGKELLTEANHGKEQKNSMFDTGDYISFSSSKIVNMDENDSEQDEKSLFKILENIGNLNSLSPTINPSSIKENFKLNEKNISKNNEASDSDDFLAGEYEALTVHKIKPNPKKKPKKKRNKNKKKC